MEFFAGLAAFLLFHTHCNTKCWFVICLGTLELLVAAEMFSVKQVREVRRGIILLSFVVVAVESQQGF